MRAKRGRCGGDGGAGSAFNSNKSGGVFRLEKEEPWQSVWLVGAGEREGYSTDSMK